MINIEVQLIVAVIVTAICFFTMPAKWALVVAVLTIIFAIGSLVAVKRRSINNQAEYLCLAIAVITLTIGWLLSSKISYVCYYIALIMFLRFAISLIYISDKSPKIVDDTSHSQANLRKMIQEIVREVMRDQLNTMQVVNFMANLNNVQQEMHSDQTSIMTEVEINQRIEFARREMEKKNQQDIQKLQNGYQQEEFLLRKQITKQLEQRYENEVIRIKHKYGKTQSKDDAKAKRELDNCIAEAKRQADIENKAAKEELDKQVSQQKQEIQNLQLENVQAKKEFDKMANGFKKSVERKNKQISDMRNQQDDYIKQLQERSEKKSMPVENEKIRELFEEAISVCKNELDIFSPWMNRHVVNNDLKTKLLMLLNRGVKIKIRYGIGTMSFQSNDMLDKNDRTEQIAQELKKEFKQYPDFKIQRDNSHSKLFICDNKFYVISSFNILSFDGDYSGESVRGELGEYSTDIENIVAYRKKFFDF